MMMTRRERMTRAPVTTPTRVSTVTPPPAWLSLVCRWDNTAEEGEDEVSAIISATTSVVVVVEDVVVVVGKHSGATGSPSSLVGTEYDDFLQSCELTLHLLQLMNKWEPSDVETALMALRLSSLWTTSTRLVWLTVMELGYILKKMQSLMITLLVFFITRLEGGRWEKVEDSIRNNLTLLRPIWR